MNQVAPDTVARQPLFFELEGGDAWSDEARRASGAKSQSAPLATLKYGVK